MLMGVGMGYEGMFYENMDYGDMVYVGCFDVQCFVVYVGMLGMGGEEGNCLVSDVFWEKCGYCSLLFYSLLFIEDVCLVLFFVFFVMVFVVVFLNEVFVVLLVFFGVCICVLLFLIV